MLPEDQIESHRTFGLVVLLQHVDRPPSWH